MSRRASNRRASCRRDDGFSLLELLASLAVLALLGTLVMGSADTGRRAWRAVSAIEDAEAVAAGETVLAAWIGQAMPLRRDSGRGGEPVFAGEPDRLRFAIGLDRGPDGPGLYEVTVGLDERAALVVVAATHLGGGQEASRPAAVSGFAPGARRLRLRYFGALGRDAQPAWSERWTGQDRLPELVSLAVDFADGRQWNDIVVSPRLAAKK